MKKSLDDIFAQALTRFNEIQTAVRDERLQCLEDRRFYSIAGAQWEGSLGDAYANRPRFEINKIHLAVIRIFNEYRNNRISVRFLPKDGTDSDKLADACAALFRADEQDSGAEEAYDNAFEEAVGGGFGAWRLRAEYEDEDDDENERQRVRIEPIFDADSCVFFDIDSKRQDKSDANYAFVLTAMTRARFEEEFNQDPASWPKNIYSDDFDWVSPDYVYVAEYYVIEKTKESKTVYRNKNNENDTLEYTQEEEDNAVESMQFNPQFYQALRVKTVEKKRVHKYILSGNGILEDEGYIAGCNIPIVPVFGKRWMVDGIERCMGHVRLAKDAQRLKNMQLSKLAEYAALSSMEKPIFTPEQIMGHQLMWSEDSIKNYPYLLINPLLDPNGNPVSVGPSAYTKPPNVPPVLAAIVQVTDNDINDLLGNQKAGEEMQPNISGKTVELIQNKLDMQSFIYVSNLAKAIKRSGEIWLGMARDLFTEPGRKMKGIGEQESVQSISLMQPTVDGDGKLIYENDFSRAYFDISVDVGPTSSSKRQAALRQIIAMLQVTQDQETASVLTSMAMLNLDGEGLTDLREYFRKKLVSLGAVKPNDKEQKELAANSQQQKQDANTIYLNAMAEKAQADAQLALARVKETQSKSMQAEAMAVKAMSDISMSDRQQTLSELQAKHGMQESSTRLGMDAQQMQMDQAQQETPTEMMPSPGMGANMDNMQ